jgi:hypothetical protein
LGISQNLACLKNLENIVITVDTLISNPHVAKQITVKTPSKLSMANLDGLYASSRTSTRTGKTCLAGSKIVAAALAASEILKSTFDALLAPAGQTQQKRAEMLGTRRGDIERIWIADLLCSTSVNRKSAAHRRKLCLARLLLPVIIPLTNQLLAVCSRSRCKSKGCRRLPRQLGALGADFITRMDLTLRTADQHGSTASGRPVIHVDEALYALVVCVHSSPDLAGGDLVISGASGGRFLGYVPTRSGCEFTMVTRAAAARESQVVRCGMSRGCAVLLGGDIEHVVENVTKGSRGSLVVFFR